jgi:serine/threonine-protein kinase HipA
VDKLIVKTDGVYCGDIIYDNSEYIFSYNIDDLKGFISLIMPVRVKDYIHKNLHPIFEMHLPEGYLLSIIKKHFSKIIKMDDFGLLKVMSPSIKGRITYKSNKNKNDERLSLDDILNSKNENLFDELVAKFALNSALSGVQPKVLAVVENKAALKLEQYIVKSWGEEYPQLALNEYYCMKIVKDANIPVPEFFISKDDKLFVMKRFDILDDGSYLGFEDMCVLMAKQREDKYEGSYEQIAKTIKTFASAKNKKSSLLNFFKIIFINYLVQNGDAHLKNFGLVYNGIDDIKLAPAYDIVSTTIYMKNDIPALHLLGSKKWWKEESLIKFGIQTCDLTNSEVKKCIKECYISLDNTIFDIQSVISMTNNRDKKEILEKLLKKFKQNAN